MADLTSEQKAEKYKRYLELDEKLIPAQEEVVNSNIDMLAGLKAERATLKGEVISFMPRQKPGPKPKAKAQRKPHVNKGRSKPGNEAIVVHNDPTAEIPGTSYEVDFSAGSK